MSPYRGECAASSPPKISLSRANGNSVGTVSAEIPVGAKWCEIRQTVFGWTFASLPDLPAGEGVALVHLGTWQTTSSLLPPVSKLSSSYVSTKKLRGDAPP